MATTHHLGLNGAVAAVLGEERHARGMTLDEVAERAGIPTVSVQRFLSARRAINLEVLDALCRGLDIEADRVVTAALTRVDSANPDLVARVRAGIEAARSDTPAPYTDATALTESR